MSEISSSSWSTSFFYEQDLRSEYMNGILNSTLKQGIYNPNMFLYTTTAGSSDNGSVKLYIRKNTTFVFSNNYSNPSDVYERDLSDVGSYLIKSTVLSDVQIDLITLKQTGAAMDTVKNILGTASYPAAEEFYIIATMEYDEDGNVTGYTIPKFRCAIKNPDYGNSSSEYSEYFFLTRSNTATSNDYLIPDGLSTLSTSNKIFSYLILGKVTDINYQTNLYYVSDSGNGQSWRGSSSVTWIANHVFTGRGFPDYRQNYLFNKNIESPDILYKRGEFADSVFLDLPSLSTQDLLIKSRANWKVVEGIGGYGTDTGTYLGYSFGDDTSLSEDISSFNRAGVVTDIFFLSTRSRYSDYDGTDVSKIFGSTDSSDEFVKEPKLLHFRWLSDCAFANLNARYTSESSETIPSGYISLANITIPSDIVPLDISSVNRDRILTLLENRNVIPAVINYLRQNNLLSPDEETSLIPAFISFRKFNSSGTFIDNVSSATRIDPSNIISFFDLQYKTSKINNITINSQDVYSIVPVVE